MAKTKLTKPKPPRSHLERLLHITRQVALVQGAVLIIGAPALLLATYAIESATGHSAEEQLGPAAQIVEWPLRNSAQPIDCSKVYRPAHPTTTFALSPLEQECRANGQHELMRTCIVYTGYTHSGELLRRQDVPGTICDDLEIVNGSYVEE